MRTFARIVWAVAMVSCSVLPASAEPADPPEITSNPEALSDAELDRRIEWLTTTLDGGAGYAKLWQYGWTSGYTLGIGIGVAQAATANSGDNRVSGIVTASKAVIGTTRLLLASHPARLGADPIREIGGSDRASKLRQLAVGESRLSRVAERAERRHRWQRHAGNVLLNLVGGAFVLGFGDATDAAISTAVGVAVGELMIFTSPRAAQSDLSDYRQRFAGAPRSRWRISLAPMANGAAIRVEF